ncbi:hypothetical protein QBC35DRAFT_950 [Podospora australis]|uniref:Nudix hydrolase domain-containing protein n=1 Tax=Podospora australis TaxID=1536484 RepID=A0AAN6X957_9PEZI|nr:hypothetical protein QBC35DRAFT_950 [Podospora australis]
MAEHKMQLEDWLDDLCVRFIINLPKEDLSSVARICFQVEEAQWFYEDFIRPLDPTLPSMSLRSFCLRIFQHCPLLASFSVENHMAAFDQFLQYKTRIPVRGAILLNEAMDSTVLVKGWKKGANWSFPRGKINKDEDDLDCAIREVYEETGFDIREAGLVPKEEDVKYIQISMREQQIRLYVFRNIPMNTNFQPKTRKEISKISWYKLSELPAFRKKGTQLDDAAAASNANKFYMVAPFLVPLKKWVIQQKKRDVARGITSSLSVPVAADEILTEDDIGTAPEPGPGPSDMIETLETATLELQRRLEDQPLLDVNPTGQASTTGADRGGALMSLLQKNSGAEMPPPHHSHQPQPYYQQQQQQQHQQYQNYQQQAYAHNSQVPHTPMEHVYANPPEPQTPHHHHPVHRLPVPPNQPPPSFPIQPHASHQVPQEYFSQQRLPAQPSPRSYGQNPYTNQPRPVHKEPVPLLHPQPLPPQVQQSLLTRGILQTPTLPDGAGRGVPQPQQGAPNYLRQAQGQYAAQQAGKPPVQLTGHTMSLLNSFKSDSRTQENTPPGITPQATVVPSGKHHTQPPSGPWASGPSAHHNPAAQYLPQPMSQFVQSIASETNAPQVSHHSANPAPISKPPRSVESHRSVLLDMFKKPGTRSPLSNEITRPTNQGSPSFSAPSAAEAIAQASEVNGAPVRMHPEVNLPYRAVQILSRPKQPETGQVHDFGGESQMQRLQKRLSPLGLGGQQEVRNTAPSLPSPRERSLMHQLEQSAKRSPSLYAAQAASLPYTQQQHQSPVGSYTSPTLQPAAVAQRQQPNANPEQKQKLLSLFGKSQPSPTGLAGNGKMKESMYEQIRSETPRSRVASLAGGVDNAPSNLESATSSRRGSQTPISPADRNFLLSYLETVTNSAR